MTELQKHLQPTLRDAAHPSRIDPRWATTMSKPAIADLERAAPQGEAFVCGDAGPCIAPHGEERRSRVSNHEGLRSVSNTLSLARLCDRAACRRAKTCCGEAERCLTLYSECVPLAAREFIIGILNAREFGYTFEEALKQHQEGARAYLDWQQSAVPAQVASHSSSSRPDLIRPMKRRAKRKCSMDWRVKPGNDERAGDVRS